MWLPNPKRSCTFSRPSTSLGKKFGSPELIRKKKHRTIPEEVAKPLWTFWSPKNAARQPLWLKTRRFENIFRSQICSKIKRTKKCMSCNLREQASFSGSFERLRFRKCPGPEIIPDGDRKWSRLKNKEWHGWGNAEDRELDSIAIVFVKQFF